MKKYVIIRIALLVIGLILIYLSNHWERWFYPRPSIGGNDGMSIPVAFVWNIGWMAAWIILLLIELLVGFFTPGNKDYRYANITLMLLGIIGLSGYILVFFGE